MVLHNVIVLFFFQQLFLDSVLTLNFNTPAPVVIPASQNFEGNDGPWSTFTLQIGTPAQDVNVLVSTTGYQTWAVIPQGCPSSGLANCAKLRGGLFNANESTSWAQNNVTSNGTFTLGLEENLGYTGNGLFGYDTVGLGFQGSNGPSLDQQIVAGIATPEFYMGMFGLDPRPTNFSNYNHPAPSYMSNLKDHNLIPSLSWAYTAGNQYRLDKVLGSLTLGGFDDSKFQANDVTFPFNDQDIRALTVGISAIVQNTNSGQKTLLNESISAFLDSTIPWIYLPLEACKQFESAFGLEWDETHQVYLVNDTLHTSLEAQNATVTFTLRSPGNTGSVDIALPYAAFDLIAEYPLAENRTRYFPLVRATNDTQYTLGRTFFQEAYVIADYERRNFSVSQCTWIANTPQHILPIHSLTEAAPTPSPSSKPRKLSKGAIAGISVGSVVVIVALSLMAYFLIRKALLRKRAHDSSKDDDSKGESASSDANSPKMLEMAGENKHPEHEIDGKPRLGQELDGKGLPGYELGGSKIEYELVGSRAERELESGQNGAAEMAAREASAAELP